MGRTEAARWAGRVRVSAAGGTHEGNACVSIDLYRVVNEGIVEHGGRGAWRLPEMVPLAAEWKHGNGML